MFCFSNVGREMACWEDEIRKRILFYDDERDIRNMSVHSNCGAVFWLCIIIMYEI